MFFIVFIINIAISFIYCDISYGYDVIDINIINESDNIFLAKKNALIDAKLKGLEIFLKQKNIQFIEINEKNANKLLISYNIINEQITKNTYSANYNLKFDINTSDKYFQNKQILNIDNILIAPIYAPDIDYLSLWGNEWTNSWILNGQNNFKLIRGDIDDLLYFNHFTLENIEKNDFSYLKEHYKVNQIIFPILYNDENDKMHVNLKYLGENDKVYQYNTIPISNIIIDLIDKINTHINSNQINTNDKQNNQIFIYYDNPIAFNKFCKKFLNKFNYKIKYISSKKIIVNILWYASLKDLYILLNKSYPNANLINNGDYNYIQLSLNT
ncbi:MAG: hypothetical protein OEY79_00680 [Anaplasmataceae bacterium]|nr:hypothetical protein [Anaplasmataceae bacterium]